MRKKGLERKERRHKCGNKVIKGWKKRMPEREEARRPRKWQSDARWKVLSNNYIQLHHHLLLSALMTQLQKELASVSSTMLHCVNALLLPLL